MKAIKEKEAKPNKKETAPLQKETEINEEENIDKIRDILFGVQVRDFEKRFLKLEKHFGELLKENRNQTNKRLAKLEGLLEKEVGSLTEKIFSEQDSRSDALKNLARESKSVSDNISKELSGFRDQTAKSEADIRKNLADESKSIVSLVEKNQKQVSKSLDTKADDLQDSKADRKTLAKAFGDIADLLSRDAKKG